MNYNDATIKKRPSMDVKRRDKQQLMVIYFVVIITVIVSVVYIDLTIDRSIPHENRPSWYILN